MTFSVAQSRCASDLNLNIHWKSQLAEPRTSVAVEAAFQLVYSTNISLYSIAIRNSLHAK